MSPALAHLKGRALRLLSQRDHTRAELERKLAAHETEAGELAQVLDDLARKGFNSEERVIESHLNRRAARLGSARLRQELAQKGVSPEATQAALAQLAQSETDRAREVWSRKFGQPAADAKGRAQQARFLMSRGFSSEVVRRVLAAARPSERPENAT